MPGKADFFSLPRTTQFAFWLGLVFVGLVIYDQLFYWSNMEDYSFGYLVPIFVAYVIYDRWPKVRALLLGENDSRLASTKPDWFMRTTEVVFYLGLTTALLMFLLGGLILASQGPSNQGSLLMAAGLGGIVLGLAFLVAREDTKGRILSWKERVGFTFLFLFPALAWLISAPMVMYMDSTVKLVLLEWVTKIVFSVFNFLGFTVIRSGNVLELPKGEVGVADACSGVRSLTGCIFVGSFMAAVFLDRFWKKVLMVGLSMVLAFVTNIMRSLFLTGWAYAYGSGAIDGDIFRNPHTLPDGSENPDFVFASVHDIAGYSVMGLTFVILLMLLPIFNFKIAPPEEEEEHEEAGESPPGGQHEPNA
ncbi:exosortase/archaeosortase family protein [Ruficoccus amylovorans]|uniref:Exosortase/archaeosortase family protein n=1 Tax=Ruficoccus amylovorans TaxID=1804625 RepID=A0A842HGM7_9BACT|nr:exosortase/archaeosortase family protein [Ruficoccus amylovorans]MBC2594776.1 exosortase/archaeosortase family protein [Ruficoccus amylovorans]